MLAARGIALRPALWLSSLGRVQRSGPDDSSPLRLTFHAWLEEMHRRTGEKITIRDFDGLDRADFQRAYNETPMTETEFQHRLGRCTMSVKLPVEAS